MTMATTVIGKITETTTETMTMEYPSLAGVKTLKIERQDLEQFRALDDGRVAVQVSGHTESLLYGSDAPFIVTEHTGGKGSPWELMKPNNAPPG